MSDYQLINNTEEGQYEFHIEGQIAKAVYKESGENIITITHVSVPSALEGKGIGSQLVKKVLNDIEKQGLKVIPICPFVDIYMQRHPEWNKILAKEEKK